MKGSYVLLIKLPTEVDIKIGSLGYIHFSRGWYAYIGSAMGGFKSRVTRHLRKDKKLHWHIDYLLQLASINKVFMNESETRKECRIAGILVNYFDHVPGFGCSACRCKSHLFYSQQKQEMLPKLSQALKPD